jgi:hypothetical protein
MFLREKIEWEIKKGVLINKESEKIQELAVLFNDYLTIKKVDFLGQKKDSYLDFKGGKNKKNWMGQEIRSEINIFSEEGCVVFLSMSK